MSTSQGRSFGAKSRRVARPTAAAVMGAVLTLGACSGNAAVSTPTNAGSTSAPSIVPATPTVATLAPSTPPATSAPIAGGRIAFVWTAPGSGVSNIASVAADGSDLRVLTNSTTSPSEGVEWVPNTDRLMFDSGRADGVHLFTMDGHGGDVRQLTTGDRFDGYPSISPDGSTIAIDESTATADLGISLLNADGTNLRRVTPPPATPAIDSLPAFSPDGKRIAFDRILDGTDGHGRSAIFVVNIDGTGLKQLTDFATNASYPNWSPDGTRIVFNDNSANGSLAVAQNIWVMNADGSHLTNLTHTKAGLNWAFAADWSPDGTRIVYVAVSTVRTLTVMNPEGSEPTVIWTAPDREGLDDPDWGPTR